MTSALLAAGSAVILVPASYVAHQATVGGVTSDELRSDSDVARPRGEGSGLFAERSVEVAAAATILRRAK